jgi:hypothetical protein
VHTALVRIEPESVRLVDSPRAMDRATFRALPEPDDGFLLSGDESPPDEADAWFGDAMVATAPPSDALLAFDDRLAPRVLDPDRNADWLPLYLMGTYADSV